MSDEPREAQRKMERVFLCNEIWFDCLSFLSRAKVGFEFALVSDRFDRLADANLGSKKRPWTLGNLWIERKTDQNETIIFNWDTKKCLPFPEEPLPDNVIGFEYIEIRYIDHKVIDFLRRICRLFQPKNNGDDGIELLLDTLNTHVRSLDIFFHSIWPLINQSVITKLIFENETFDAFCHRISPTFLLDLANLRVISAEDVENEENDQFLLKWLHIPRKDGKPKLPKEYSDRDFETVEQLKMEFLSAKTAVSFIIGVYCDGAVPFKVDNLRTGECLTFRKVDYCTTRWPLERGPIGGGRNVEQWAKWEREALDMNMEQPNLLAFSFFDDAIGPLDGTAGPSDGQ